MASLEASGRFLPSLEASEDRGSKTGESIAMDNLHDCPPITKKRSRSSARRSGTSIAIEVKMIDSFESQIRDSDLFLAAGRGDASLFRSLSPEQLSTALSLRDEEGRSLLHAAAKFGRIEVVRFFAEADPSGSLVNGQDEKGWAPIITTSSLGYLDIVKELIVRGANVNPKNHLGHTPLHYASFKGRLKVALFLISHGAEINAKDKVGCTPLHKAAGEGNLDLCKLLIMEGAEINAADQAGQTPLTHAVICNQKEAVLLLIKHGADMTDKVEYAVLRRYPSDYLVEARDPCFSSKDWESKTRMSIALDKLPHPYKVRLSGSGFAVNQVCLPYSAFSSHNEKPLSSSGRIINRVCHDTGLLTDSITLENAKIALSNYNEKRLSRKGREYELVEALGGTFLVRPSVYHCNFIARPKNGSEAQNRLFFAELKDGGLACTVCSIIGCPGTKTGLCGCKICKEYGGLIQHPRRKKGFTKWRT